jgi:hypothetical protein
MSSSGFIVFLQQTISSLVFQRFYLQKVGIARVGHKFINYQFSVNFLYKFLFIILEFII